VKTNNGSRCEEEAPASEVKGSTAPSAANGSNTTPTPADICCVCRDAEWVAEAIYSVYREKGGQDARPLLRDAAEIGWLAGVEQFVRALTTDNKVAVFCYKHGKAFEMIAGVLKLFTAGPRPAVACDTSSREKSN
jgi:hypothetical protein